MNPSNPDGERFKLRRFAGASDHAPVSVIVATLASSARSALLQRAIASIRASSRRAVTIIVVVNGQSFDAVLCQWLKDQSDIVFHYVAAPSAPGAICEGRKLVQTPFFATLDDDDVYLPGMTDQKLFALQATPQADLLVTNAYLCQDGLDHLLYQRLHEVPENPLPCLMQFNWLSSGNALYKTAAVESRHFEAFHPYAEWTWLAFRLALDGKKIAVMNRASCRHHNTPESLSKSKLYLESYIPLFERMLASAPPASIARLILRKMAAAQHDASVAALREGRRIDAWRHHWRSLSQAGGWKFGWKFLTYTRHLCK